MPFHYLAVVGRGDCALFELGTPPNPNDNRLQLRQFILHASLDAVQEAQWSTPAHYLKAVDRYENYSVSAYVVNADVRLLLMQDTEPYDNTKHFLHDMADLVVRHMLNPFVDPGKAFRSREFLARATQLQQQHF